jgi:hypothetical protein
LCTVPKIGLPINQKRNHPATHRCFGFDQDSVESLKAKFTVKNIKNWKFFMFDVLDAPFEGLEASPESPS